MSYKAAIIGCGKPWKSEGATGSGMGHGHARGYLANSDTRLISVVDLEEENAKAFQAIHGGDSVYTSYQEMLISEKPEIVSICTWPGLHEEMVLACAEAGVLAVHCEKPIAPTWASSKRMVHACALAGTQLTFNHQRRFDLPYIKARDLIRAHRIGELKTMEFPTGNMFDWGTHWFDMMFFMNEESPAVSVLGQVEPTGGPSYFGVKVEGQGISYIKFENGVSAIMPAGEHSWGVQVRLVGTKGVIEIGATGWDTLRVWSIGQSDWHEVSVDRDKDLPDAIGMGIANLVESLKSNQEPELSARRALRATELIFATYESARIGRRIDLPFLAEDAEIYAY